ncbi:MAG: hypothetical protein JWM91_1339 [Rhodospirillales bacterium]|nr:hypothetical protein [Rhodospirillales bacterium]
MVFVFALAALAFFYVLLYHGLSSRVDDTSAAAILFGANLLLIAVMLIGRALMKPKAPTVSSSPILGMLKSHAESLGSSNGNFNAGIKIGNQIGKHIRKAAPQIAIAAAVLGLVIGVRPQILGLFRRREPPNK